MFTYTIYFLTVFTLIREREEVPFGESKMLHLCFVDSLFLFHLFFKSLVLLSGLGNVNQIRSIFLLFPLTLSLIITIFPDISHLGILPYLPG